LAVLVGVVAVGAVVPCVAGGALETVTVFVPEPHPSSRVTPPSASKGGSPR
jgi:hypothetical protein